METTTHNADIIAVVTAVVMGTAMTQVAVEVVIQVAAIQAIAATTATSLLFLLLPHLASAQNETNDTTPYTPLKLPCGLLHENDLVARNCCPDADWQAGEPGSCDDDGG